MTGFSSPVVLDVDPDDGAALAPQVLPGTTRLVGVDQDAPAAAHLGHDAGAGGDGLRAHHEDVGAVEPQDAVVEHLAQAEGDGVGVGAGLRRCCHDGLLVRAALGTVPLTRRRTGSGSAVSCGDRADAGAVPCGRGRTRLPAPAPVLRWGWCSWSPG